MKVLICGSRKWRDAAAIRDRVNELPDDAIVIAGGADGADHLAAYFAHKRALFVAEMPVKGEHWDRYGNSAGHKRNHAMLDLGPDLVIAFQVFESSDTQGTIDEARWRGIPVEVRT